MLCVYRYHVNQIGNAMDYILFDVHFFVISVVMCVTFSMVFYFYGRNE